MSDKKNTLNFGKIGDIHLKLIIPQLDECYPGFSPSEYNLVVAPGVPPKTVGKAGLILISEDTKDQLGMAVQVGRIIAVSPLAFNFAQWPDDAFPPQLGDIVWFAKYAGGVFEGADGREYRLIKDKDITGIIPPIDEQRLSEVKALNENKEQKVA